jgi:hypothetical protein
MESLSVAVHACREWFYLSTVCVVILGIHMWMIGAKNRGNIAAQLGFAYAIGIVMSGALYACLRAVQVCMMVQDGTSPPLLPAVFIAAPLVVSLVGGLCLVVEVCIMLLTKGRVKRENR